MKTQLTLLDENRRVWKLDQRTREIGRKGVADAREALRRATAADHHDRAGADRAA